MKTTLTLTKLAGLITLLLLLGFSQQANAAAGIRQQQDELSSSASGQPYGQGTINQRLMTVVVTPNIANDQVTNLTFTLTNPEQIARVTIFVSQYGIPDPTVTSSIFGTPIDNPEATASFSGTYTISNTSARNFHLMIDLKPDATVGTTVDAVCTSVTSTIGTSTITDQNMQRFVVVAANLTGTKTVSATGDYIKLTDVIKAINTYGVGTGGVTFNVADDETFTQTSVSSNYDLIRQTGTAANPIIIQRSGTGSAKPIINCDVTTSNQDCFVGGTGVDYITIDGLDLRATGTLSTQGMERAIYFTGTYNKGCSHNEIKNCVINVGNTYNRNRNYGISFVSRATQTSGTNNFNKIHHNAISNVDAAIDFNDQGVTPALTLSLLDEGNEVYNNTITGEFAKQQAGINIKWCKDTKIYNNVLDGTGVTTVYATTRYGIYSEASSNAGYIYCYGNTVKNMKINMAQDLIGISVCAPTVRVYNNVVANLTNEFALTATKSIYGISLPSHNTASPYYDAFNNSVYLNQTVVNSFCRTAALAITSNQTITGVNLINNVLVNASTTGTQANIFVLYSERSKTALVSTSDNNLYYPEAANFVKFSDSGASYNTLAALKTALANREQNSVSGDPLFVGAAASDLTITSASSPASNAGKAVTVNITADPFTFTDISGIDRHATTPDLGAYEIPVPTVSVDFIELTGFTYLQGAGPSAEQSFEVSGSYLTSDITVTPPANYEISTTSGSGFVSTPITLTKTGNSVAATLIYVRLKAGLAVATYNGEQITAVSGTSTKTVTVSGSVDVSTSVDNPSDNIKVLTNGSKIVIIGAAGKSAEIYNSVGMKLASVKNMEAVTEMPINAKGLMLVKIDSKVAKIIIK